MVKLVVQSPPHPLITVVDIFGILCLTTNELELKNITREGYCIAYFEVVQLIGFLI